MLGFFGSFTNTMDAKGRVAVPAQFRKPGGLEDELMLVPSVNKDSLNLFNIGDFDAWLESMFGEEGFKANDPVQAQWVDWVCSNAANVEVDKSGRINIPQNLRDDFGLSEKVLFKGARDHVGIWSPEAWEARMKDFDPAVIYRPQA